MAMSATFVGTGIGGAFMAPVSNWIILSYSWRAAFAFNGVILLVLVVPIILFVIHARPSEIGLEPYRDEKGETDTSVEDWGVSVKEAFKLPAFWQIAAIMFIIGLVTNGVHTHAVTYLRDIGHSPTTAAYIWSVVMLVMVLGKLSYGPLADRWGAPKASAGEFVFYTVSILALIFAGPFGLALVFAGLYGFACGGPLTLNPLLTVGNLGIKNFGTIFGILTVMASIGAAIGTVGAGAFYDRFETYLPIFAVFAVLTVLGAVCSAFIKAPERSAKTAE
jgi:sugar phosphate permease